MPWAALAIGGLSGIGNFLANSSANDRAAMLQNQQFQQWMQLNVPDPAQQQVAMQQFVSAGKLTPQLETAIKQDPSSFQKIVTDSGQKAAQNTALSQLEDIGRSGGLRLQDKAALQDATLKTQQQARGNRNAIAANMAQRGLGGSGFDVAAQLQGQQGEADQNAKSSLQVAAGAQDRALSAIEGAGNMATQQRSQDFGEQAQKASAADRINQFNTENSRNVNAQNTGIANSAQSANLQNAQNLSNQNTQLSNSQQLYNKGLLQQQYQNQVQKLAGATGQANQVAGTDQKGGQILGNTISNLGTGAAGAISSQNNYDLLNNYLKSKNSSGSQDEEDY